MYLRLFDRSKDSEYLATAKAYADTALAHVAELGYTYCGFNWGSTGVYRLVVVIQCCNHTIGHAPTGKTNT